MFTLIFYIHCTVFFSLFIYLFICLRCNVGVMANYTQDFKRGVAGFPARSCHLYIYLTKISIRLWKISPILSRVVVAFDDFLQCVYTQNKDVYLLPVKNLTDVKHLYMGVPACV